MKKTKGLIIFMALAITTASLVGCGSQTEATNQAATNQEEVTVATDDNKEKETENKTEETEEVVIPTDCFVVFDADSSLPGYMTSDVEFETVNLTVTPDENIPVYGLSGYNVGYIKAGSTFTITGEGINGKNMYRFENPVSGMEDEYLFISKKDFEVAPTDTDTTSLEEVKNLIIENLSYRVIFDKEYDVNITEPSSDMEYMDCVIRKDIDLDYAVRSAIGDDSPVELIRYSTFAVEMLSEDEAGYNCRIYYKDAFDLDAILKENGF